MKFAWNSNKTGSVNLDKVRNFTINFTATGTDLVAWFSDKETYLMGKFKNKDDAIKFLNELHEGADK